VATEVIRIIEPAGGGNYTSLDAWEDALGGTTTGHLINDDMIATAACRDSSGVTPDTAPVTVIGWTTGANNYIQIVGTDFPSSTGIFDATKYHLSMGGGSVSAITSSEDYVRYDNLQILMTESSSWTSFGIYVVAVGTPTDIRLSKLIIKGVCSGTGTVSGIYVNDATATVTIWNTVVYGFISGDDTQHIGMNFTNCSSVSIYNCTVYNCYSGILQAAGTVTATNCAVFNCTDDFTGTVAMTYCASDDDHTGDSATNITITQSADDWAALVTDAAGGDFSVTDADSQLYDAGTPDLFTEDDDIIGTARPQGSAWDIGAFELVVAAGENYEKTFDDGVGITDAKSISKTIVRGFDESLGVADAEGHISNALRTLAESLGITDAQIKGESKVLAESLGITDAAARNYAAIKILADTLGIADANLLTKTIVRGFDESLGISDAEERIIDSLRTFNESFGLTDARISSKGIYKTIADSLGLTDEMSGVEGGAAASNIIYDYSVAIGGAA